MKLYELLEYIQAIWKGWLEIQQNTVEGPPGMGPVLDQHQRVSRFVSLNDIETEGRQSVAE